MKHRKGFTLIELLVVVAVLGVLLAIVVPRLLNSTDDANAALLAKTARDVREAVVIGKLKCLDVLTTAATGNPDTQAVLNALASAACSVIPQNAYDVEGNAIKVKDFTMQTDLQLPAGVLTLTVDCKGSNTLCNKVKERINEMYGNGTCGNPTGGILTCNFQV
jgi:prepilin-type N-terminal cleavage/methylation domain-containing protein